MPRLVGIVKCLPRPGGNVARERRVRRVGPGAGGGERNAPSETSSERPVTFLRTQDHFDHFLRLIDWEFEDEQEAVEERLSRWPREKLVEQGVTLFNLGGRTAGTLYGERIIRLRPLDGDELPHHRFGRGDMVHLSRKNPLKEKTQEGVVLSANRREVRIVLAQAPAKLRDGQWRLDRGANRVSYDRMKGALQNLFETEDATVLRELLLGMPKEMDASAARVASLGGQERKLTQVHIPSDLNASQAAAVQAAMQRRLTLIQGPPGTGKTHTAVRLIEGWARAGVGPILAVANSNVAVDNLLERLLERGVRATRIGSPVKVREELRRATLHAQMDEHHLREEVEDLMQLNRDLQRKLNTLQGKEKGLAHRDLNMGWKTIRRLENEIRDDILETTQVVCATCIGAGHQILDGRRFPLVLIDEATQATEPTTLVPLCKGARHVVLVGDHKQLPPTVPSARAEAAGLDRSLFERLTLRGLTPMMLTEQFRMHPAIREFPSARFYDDRLSDGIEAADRPPAAGFPWPDPAKPVAFIPVDAVEDESGEGSKENLEEAHLCLKLVNWLVDAGEVRARDIGIITPYNGQVRLLKRLFDAEGGTESEGRYPGLEIRSVDGYQGREKEVILLSAVRANDRREVGFLRDWRRLNVAITRARRGLIVIGNPATLRHDPNWDAWMDWATSSGLDARWVTQM